MAFPTVRSKVTTPFGATVTSYVLNMPPTIVAGDIILAGLDINGGDQVFTWDSTTYGTWTLVFDDARNNTSGPHKVIYAKIADGSEAGGSITVTSTLGYRGVGWAWSIQDHAGTLAAIEATLKSGDNSAAPNTDTITPSWGAQDTLFISSFTIIGGNTTVTAYPTNYVDNQDNAAAGGGPGAGYAISSREFNVATEDPGAYTLSGANSWVGVTLAVQPAGGGDVTPPILTLPTGVQTGATTASGTVTTDEGNGTLFYLATINATETAATIKAGSSQTVSATGIQNVTVTGLTASTTYFLHYVHDDAATNESNVVTSASFTTDALTASIDSNDSPVLDASVGNAFTTSGYTGDVNVVTIDSGSFQINVLNLAGTAGNFTYDMPDIDAFPGSTVGIPFNTASHSHVLTASLGAETDSAPIVPNPKAGWAVVEVLNATGVAGSVFEGFTILPVDGDQVYYSTANNQLVQPNGIYFTDKLTGTETMWAFDTLDGTWDSFDVLISTATYPVSFPSLGLSGTATWNAANSRYEVTITGIQTALVADIGNSIPVDITKV